MSQEFKRRMAAEDEICRKIRNNEAALEQNQRKREEIAENLWVLPYPVWQQISKLYKGCHNVDAPHERARLVRKFVMNVERLIRFELRAMEASRNEAAHTAGGDAITRGGGDTPVPGRVALSAEEPTWVRPSVEWTPIPAICTYLEISQRKLSALCKEITGFAIEQLVDCIKAETLRASLKEKLKTFVLQWFQEKREQRDEGRRDAGGPSGRRDAGGPKARDIYADLKRSRREDFFDRTTWAMGLGFSSYQKLFRASELTERLSPHELEIAIIEELLPGTPCVHGQNQEISRKDAETQRKDAKNDGKENAMLIKEVKRADQTQPAG